MRIEDVPLFAVRNGGTAEASEVNGAIATLEAVASLLESADPVAIDRDDVMIDMETSTAFLNLETSMIGASIHHAGHPGVMVRCPRIDGEDAAAILATVCRISIATLRAADVEPDEELVRTIVARNDAVCATVALARGDRRVDGVTMRPASPFRPMRVTLTCGGEIAEWTASPGHEHWVAARHVGFSAYLVPNGSIHLHLDDLTRHAGPDVSDPISVMRLIADLPDGPPVVIPEDAWEPMF